MARIDPSSEQLLSDFRRRVDGEIQADLAAEQQASDALHTQVVAALRSATSTAREAGARGRVWLFGSFAWGQPNASSDVDLLLDGADEDEGAFVRAISGATDRELHVIRMTEAPDSLRERVLREGMPL